MPRVFICYRREDSAPYAGRLHDRLSAEFGARNVFMDLESVGPGDKFEDHIRAAVDQTDVAVIVIGPRWLEVHDEEGRPRIASKVDFVRREIAMVLGDGVQVIPALVGRATLPPALDLPRDIRPLSTFQAIELSDLRWAHDVRQLVNVIHACEPKRPSRWPTAFRTKRGRKMMLWTYRALTPIVSIGGIFLLQRIMAALHFGETYTLVATLLFVGVVTTVVQIIEKSLGVDRA